MAKRDKKNAEEPPPVDDAAVDRAWRSSFSPEKLARLRRAWARAQGRRIMPGEKDGGRAGDGPERRREK